MYKNVIGLKAFKYRFEFGNNGRSKAVKILARLHQIQIVLWFNIKKTKYLVEHFTVLGRNADPCIKIGGIFFKFLYQGSHFYSFWSGTEYNENFFHFYLIIIYGKIIPINIDPQR